MSEVARREILNTEQVRQDLRGYRGSAGILHTIACELLHEVEMLRADRDALAEVEKAARLVLRHWTRVADSTTIDVLAKAILLLDQSRAVHGSGEEPGA